jgi:phosphoglycerol transferase MdoB-like AlkP superfamily enzyme
MSGPVCRLQQQQGRIAEAISAEQQASVEPVLEAEAVASNPPAPRRRDEPGKRPSIVFLMSESFFDVTKLPNVTFSEDPLPNFHRLSASSTNGGFHSNTYSGGTGNVEMEMFTGISGVMLKESETLTSLASGERYRALPSMVRQLREAGYRTTAIHAHTNSLFERSLSFPAIGFEEVLFSDSFPEDVEIKGGYVSDMALAREMIRLFEARSQADPHFLYALSMENHQPYTANKFAEPLEIELSSPVLTQEDLGVLSALVQGLMDADESLGFLLDYFEAQDEPVIFVFCGDHLPGMYLSKEETVYSKTGYASTRQNP